jgi:hypothetical protein
MLLASPNETKVACGCAFDMVNTRTEEHDRRLGGAGGLGRRSAAVEENLEATVARLGVLLAVAPMVLLPTKLLGQSAQGGRSLADVALRVMDERLPPQQWPQRWVVYPDLLADGVAGAALLYAGWCNERRLQLVLQSLDQGQIPDAASLASVDERRFRCGAAYTPVWGERSRVLEAALVKRWLRHGDLDVDGIEALDRAGAALWGRHAGFRVGFSPLAGGIADEGTGIARWRNCAAASAAAEDLDGGILGQCIWHGIAPPADSELGRRCLELCRMPEFRPEGPVAGTLVSSPGDVVLAGEPAQWRAVAVSLGALQRVVGDLEQSGILVEVIGDREDHRGLHVSCVRWLQQAVTAVGRVVEAMDAGRRQLSGRELCEFWRAVSYPPTSLLRFRHARERWAFGGSVEIVDGVLHARLDAPREEFPPLDAPPMRPGFGHARFEELAKRKADGPKIRGWRGIYYVGTDDAYHYFAVCTLYVHRLAIPRSKLQVQGAQEPSDDEATWVDVSGHDLRLPVLNLRRDH